MRRIGILLLVLLLVIVTGCAGTKTQESQTTEENQKPKQQTEVVRLTLGTGSTGGTFYLYGGGVASIVNSDVQNVELLVEGTPGTVANLELLQSGKLDLTLAECVPTYEKMKAIGWAEGQEPFANVRALTPMYFAHFGMWSVREDISKPEDINGKVVGPGPFGSGAERMGKNALNVLGIVPKEYQNMGWGDSCTALADGQIDVATISTGHPSPALLELETKKTVQHIRFSESDLDKIVQAYPYYGVDVLPAGMYKDLKSDYKTIGTWDAIITTTEFDEELAYQITKAIMENNETLVNTHPTGKESISENIVKQPIPLHKGALRYYNEIGLEIPSHLIPPEAQ